jgi:hydrogenase expression/formation protein HypE
VVKPGIGRDAAVINFRGRVLVFSTDPITGTATNIGAHSVIINANDVATTGAMPLWYLCTLMLPHGARENLLRRIMSEVDRASRDLGIAVAGGHTEITMGLTRPIIAGFMIGEAKGRVVTTEDGRPGDKVLLAGTAGIEGTGIIASDFSRRIRAGAEFLARAKRFRGRISIVREALALARLPGVHALHDPTEGGVLNGIWEIAEASKVGVEVWADRIPIARETRLICERLKLDPLKLMASGALLAAVQPSAVRESIGRLRKLGVKVSEIGELTPKGHGRKLWKNGRVSRLEAVPRDEIYRLA